MTEPRQKLSEAERTAKLLASRRPAWCMHCTAEATPSSDPAVPATCCADPLCVSAEAQYQRETFGLQVAA